MANTSCQGEVEKMGQKMCALSLCDKIQSNIDERCHAKDWKPGEPYIVYKEDGSICYCCCSCFSYNTPIAVGDGLYRLIQDFVVGDTVLAAGRGLKWESKTVQFSSGLKPADEAFMVYLRYNDSEGQLQELIVTEDHLFLQPGGRLIPASYLTPNDVLIAADGTEVPIQFVVSANYNGGVHHIATGDYDGKNLDGHLLNSNGIVSADFAVQIKYITGQLSGAALIDGIDSRAIVGSERHIQEHTNTAATAFIGDPSQWPEGVRIYHRANLVTVPPDARSFITDEQAQAILDSDAPRREFTNQAALERTSYLFRLFKGFYPKPIFILDWNNPLPNSYAWQYYGQDFILLTGGLVRMYSLYAEGLGLIISHNLASLYGNAPEIPSGLECVGPADYVGVGVFMSNVWRDQAFAQTYSASMKQIRDFFSYIPPELSTGGGDPGSNIDKCLNPSIECRLRTYSAAAAVENIPHCADPSHEGFGVIGATGGPGQVLVQFNEDVNKDTAEMAGNYKLTPECEIASATVSTFDASIVVLSAPIEVDVLYTLQVQGVLSAYDEPLDSAMNTAEFSYSNEL